MALHRIRKTADEEYLDECISEMKKWSRVKFTLTAISIVATVFTLAHAINSINPNENVLIIGYLVAVATIVGTLVVGVHERHHAEALIIRNVSIVRQKQRELELYRQRVEELEAPHAN
jgi:flagellar motor component MotA